MHISDLHFGSEVPGAVDALITAAWELGPDAVLVSGDVTLRGTRAEFERAADVLGRLPQPTLVVPGNHDIPARNLARRFLQPMAHFRRYIGEPEWAHEVGGASLLGLNTARSWGWHWNWAHGRYSASQIARVLEHWGSQPVRTRVLVAHHPFDPPSDLRSFRAVGRRSKMLGALGRAGVSVALVGHIHRTATMRVRPPGADRELLIVQAGTALSHRTRDGTNAFVELVLGDGEPTIREWRLEDGRFTPTASRL